MTLSMIPAQKMPCMTGAMSTMGYFFTKSGTLEASISVRSGLPGAKCGIRNFS